MQSQSIVCIGALRRKAVTLSRRSTTTTTTTTRFLGTTSHPNISNHHEGGGGGNNNSQFSSLWWPVLGVLAVTTLGGVKYAHDHLGGTEGEFASDHANANVHKPNTYPIENSFS
jgi:hypothetical protein